MKFGEVILLYIVIPIALIPIILFIIALIESIIENIIMHFKDK